MDQGLHGTLCRKRRGEGEGERRGGGEEERERLTIAALACQMKTSKLVALRVHVAI